MRLRRTTLIVLLPALIILAATFLDRPGREPRQLRRRAEEQMRTLLLLSQSEALRGFQLAVLKERSEAQGWQFVAQSAEPLSFTGNETLPYVVTIETKFAHPHDAAVFRTHTAAFVYHAGRGWLPLLEETSERGPDYVRPVNTKGVW